MSIPSNPGLEFYYSLKLIGTRINRIDSGRDIIQTANGFLFADPEYKIPIGKFAFNITIYDVYRDDVPVTDDTPRTFQVTGTNVYFLPQGTISHSINLSFIRDPQGNFVVPPDVTNVYQILSGSGDFLNAKGFFIQLTNDELGRKMIAYFDK